MSFKGQIEAKCPKGCEPFETEIWSFIRGDKSIELRDAVLARECNLILCDACSTAFVPPEPYVYYEPNRELLAFVFPESYREKEQYWRTKMAEDFVLMKEGLGGEATLDLEPSIFFGVDELALVLEDEDYRGEEDEVMEFIAKEMGLSIYRVGPRYARERRVPGLLPYAPKRPGEKATRESVLDGLEKIVAANDRLTAFSGFLAKLKDEAELPPASAVKAA